MREFFAFIKNLFENKRTRALAILIIYFIFFLFVFSLFSSSNSTSQDEFTYLKNIEIVNYNVSNGLSFDRTLIKPDNIYKIIKNSTLESTNYIENSNTYSITIADFEKNIYGKDVTFEGYIKTIIYKDKIILDLTEYYGYKIELEIRS